MPFKPGEVDKLLLTYDESNKNKQDRIDKRLAAIQREYDAHTQKDRDTLAVWHRVSPTVIRRRPVKP
jgi:hypothetical protein